MSDNQDLDRSRPQLLDLLHTLQGCEDRESALRAVMDMVAGVFQPGSICYLPEDGGRPLGDCGPWTAGVHLLPNQIVKLLPSKKGIALAIKEKGVRVGMLCADGVDNPRSLDDKLPMLLIIPDALEIAFSNIRLLQELRDSQDRLARLSESLGVANKILRHDIANELLVISSSLDLYKLNNREKDLLRAQASLQRMQNIIAQMRELDHFLLSRTEMASAELREVIDKVMKGLDMPYSVVGEGKVLADPALAAIIENLARNAKRHGKAERMEFIITPSGKRTMLLVRDDGTGIKEEYLSRVLMEGVAFGESRGTGLGLYLVLRTMQRYGGDITAGNDPRGGARFELTFRSA
ncbi:MAG: sensor protein RstB [Methanomassiliicoccales archaeon PtaB.Bin215]|nr:MAG: sensor protein RstB [Methanomassiliicoccales archaeon PtaB.Bin215]